MKADATHERATAFAAAVLGIAIFSLMDAMMKTLVLAMGVYTTLLWRSLAGTVIAGGLYWARPRAPMTREKVRVHALRGAVTTAMAVAFFWGLARVPMAQAIALTFTAPLLSIYLSALFLGERVERGTIAASAIALVGVAIIVAGQWQSDLGPEALRGTIAVVLSSVLYAFNIVLMRRQALVANPTEVAFSQSAIVTLLLALGGPLFATLPPLEHLPLLFLAAACAVVSLQLLAWAYARADASRLSTSEYTSFLWAAALGWMVFDEPLRLYTVAGAVFIVAGCLVAARGKRPLPPAGEIA